MKIQLFRECYGSDGSDGTHLPHRPTPALPASDRRLVIEFLLGELLLARRVLLMLRETDHSVEWGTEAKDGSRALLVEMLGRVVPPRTKEDRGAYEARLLRVAAHIRHRATGDE